VLGVDILTDLVRSYTSQAASVVPSFLQASFEMLREGQSKAMENMSTANPMSAMPGFDAMRAQQEAFFKAMTGGMMGTSAPAKEEDDDLDDMKAQLKAMQDKLNDYQFGSVYWHSLAEPGRAAGYLDPCRGHVFAAGQYNPERGGSGAGRAGDGSFKPFLENCHFLLETGATHRLLDQLDARALDVVVAADMGPISEAMETYPLMEEPFIVAAPKGAVQKEDLLAFMRSSPFIHYTTRQHMGRLITDHLARQNITMRHRFELDSYHSILAMVEQGAGWAILTPLGWRRAGRLTEEVDVFELPFEPLSRKISLTARRDVLGEMPKQMAEALRPQIQSMIVDPAKAALPWLRDSLRLL